MDEQKEPVHVKQLSNGCWHIKGAGMCNWATVKQWPCHQDTIRECAGGEASEEFIHAAAQLAIDTATKNHKKAVNDDSPEPEEDGE